MNFPDYYAILGVSPEDDHQVIQRAYRKKAVENHPDRGGSHGAMVLVNEAWFVLRDAGQRAAYDRERSGNSSSSNAEAVRQAAYKAYDQAQHYPKSADNLDDWFGRIAKDFASAQYGQTEPWGGRAWWNPYPSFPTAAGSSSARLFIAIGAIAGFSVGVLVVYLGNPIFSKPPTVGIWIISAIAGGAWLGQGAHELVAQALTSHPRPQQPESLKRIIYCCRCNQKLLVPKDVHNITVTCQKCNTRFDVD